MRKDIQGIIVFLIALAFLTGATLGAMDKNIISGSNVQVSKKLANRAHYEILLASDPKNADRLLGGSMVFSEERNDYSLVAYCSFDGGKTWSPTLEVTDLEGACDPAVCYGPDGSAFFVLIGSNSVGKGVFRLYHSKDGGITWLPPIEVPAGIDREYVSVDTTGGKYNGRLYIQGVAGLKNIDQDKNPTDITIFRSLDGGETFEHPVKLLSLGDKYVLGMGNSVVLSDGTLVILFGELRKYEWEGEGVPPAESGKPNAWLKVVTSEDGGESFSKASVVNDLYMPWGWSTTGIPSLAVDQSSGPFKDRLYAAWQDLRSGHTEIFFSVSIDKGKTWSNPLIINDDRAPIDPSKGPNHFMPVVAVNPFGVVGIMWYDRRENPDNLGWWVRFTASFDGGESFLASERISEAPFSQGKNDKWVMMASGSGGGNPEKWLKGGSLKVGIGVHGFYFNGGHTAGMVADGNGIFHPFWVDNRTGIPQVWTAAINISGKAVRNGSPEIAELEDISEKVTIDYKNISFDQKTNILSVDAQIRNTSEEILSGPVKIRVIRFNSDIGIPKILESDNGDVGIGAIWDISPLLKNNQLKPKEVLTKRLKFQISDLRALRPSKDYMIRLVNIEAKALGKLEKIKIEKE